MWSHTSRTSPFGKRFLDPLDVWPKDSDGDRWIKEVALGPTPKPVVYMKHMAKQVIPPLSF